MPMESETTASSIEARVSEKDDQGESASQLDLSEYLRRRRSNRYASLLKIQRLFISVLHKILFLTATLLVLHVTFKLDTSQFMRQLSSKMNELNETATMLRMK